MKGVVEGPRSPSWAVWKRMVIRGKDGHPYLDRRRIIDTPWFGIYLHRITDVDPQPDPHDHPWPFLSIVLAGSYTEEVYVRWDAEPEGVRYRRRWLPLTMHRMSMEKAHRIIDVMPHTLTIILRGKRSRDWGFWDLDENGAIVGWTSWKDYEK